MKKIIYILTGFLIIFTLVSCGVYSFTGGDTGNAKTIQVDFFRNEAPLVEPSVSQRFTDELRGLFQRQTNLSMVNTGGDLHFEGEITDYRIAPMSATANQTASQNRLTITINVRYINKLDEKKDFEKPFSFYADFPGDQNPQGAVLEGLLQEIFENITGQVFTASVGKW